MARRATEVTSRAKTLATNCVRSCGADRRDNEQRAAPTARRRDGVAGVEDLSDIERAEQLRTFVAREPVVCIVGGIALGLAAVAGCKYWQAKRAGRRSRPRASTPRCIDGAASEQARRRRRARAASCARSTRARRMPTRRISRWRGSPSTRREYDEAAKRLRAVIDGSRDPQLRQVARTRLARVLIEQGKHDEALALLTVADGRRVRGALPRHTRRRLRRQGRCRVGAHRVRRGARGRTPRADGPRPGLRRAEARALPRRVPWLPPQPLRKSRSTSAQDKQP